MSQSTRHTYLKVLNLNWWMDSFYYARAVAIDIAQDKVTVAFFDKNVFGITLIDWQIFSVNIIADKNVGREEEGKLLAGLKAFLEKNRIGSDSEIVIGLPRNFAICKFIEIPSPDEKNIKDILCYDIERHIPVAANEIYYDYEIIEKKAGNRFKVMLVAIKVKIADYYISLFQKISLNVGVIYLSSFAGVNIYNHVGRTQNKEQNLLVSTGRNYFEFLLIQNGQVSLAKNFKLNPTIYPWITLLFSDEKTGVDGCGDFIFDQYKQIQSSSQNYEFKDISRIVLTGEGPLWEKVCTYITEDKKVHAVCLETTKMFVPTGVNGTFENSLSTAIGLGLRGVSNLFLNINLMPGAKKSGLKKKSVITTIILIVLFLFSSLSALFSGYIKDRMKLSNVEKQVSQLKKDILKIEGFGIKSEELEKRIEEFSALKNKSISKLKIVKELSDIIPPPVWITNLTIVNDKLQINGYADDASDIIKIIEESPFLKDVKFLGTIKKDKGREKFRLEAHLE